MPSIRKRLSENEAYAIDKGRESKENIIVIGDLHEPFSKDGYLEHCIDVSRRYNCNRAVFIGDVLDNHYSSFHPTDPDGYGAGDELDRAINKLSRWHDAFPDADVIEGNHDLIVQRQLFANGISNKWLKSYQEVLELPTWKFHKELVINNVLYHHGTGTSGANAARKRAQEANMSVVIGHIHTEASIQWHADRRKRYFGLMVGCGVDERSYAAAYGRNYPRRMIVSCGVVADDGTLPYVVPMEM
jgi:hypothetical protein